MFATRGPGRSWREFVGRATVPSDAPFVAQTPGALALSCSAQRVTAHLFRIISYDDVWHIHMMVWHIHMMMWHRVCVQDADVTIWWCYIFIWWCDIGTRVRARFHHRTEGMCTAYIWWCDIFIWWCDISIRVTAQMLSQSRGYVYSIHMRHQHMNMSHHQGRCLGRHRRAC